MSNSLCPGSNVPIHSLTQSVLCYCGVTFKRKLKSIRQWVIPPHSSSLTGIYNVSHRFSLRKDIIKEGP